METKRIYLNELINEWLHEIKGSRTFSTYAKYRQLAQNYILPYFENMCMSDLTEPDMNLFRSNLLLDSENHLSAGTIRCIFMIINAALEYAYHQKIIEKKLSVSINSERKKHIVQVFSTKEQKKLESFLRQNMNLSALGLYLCLYTGLRLGEVCSLRWEDINLENEYIYVKRTVQRLPVEDNAAKDKTRLMVTNPKSSSAVRVIPIPSFLVPFLNFFSENVPIEHFFLTGTENPMEPRTFQYQYKKYLEMADLSYLNFHTLRHTFATRCIMIGMDPKTLSEILGHSDIKITLEYYFHSSFEFKKKQMELLSSLS